MVTKHHTITEVFEDGSVTIQDAEGQATDWDIFYVYKDGKPMVPEYVPQKGDEIELVSALVHRQRLQSNT